MIDLQLLGGLTVQSPELSSATAVRRRHPMALLALAAASAPKGIGRDRIMAFLWPESDPDKASNSLRQTVFLVRRDLGDEFFLPDSAGRVLLDPEVVSVDLWRFRDALDRGAQMDAIAAYAGPFLDGFHMPGVPDFTRWVESERYDVGRQYVEAIDTVARQAEDDGRLDDAVSWRRRQTSAEPYSSRAALALLKALVAAGDRTGALQHAGVYENIVRQHLDSEPDPSVTRYVESLRKSPKKGTNRREAEPSGFPRVESGAEPVAVGRGDGEGRGAGRLQIAMAVLLTALGTVAVGSILSDDTRPTVEPPAGDPTVVVLGSGLTTIAGRDVSNRLVECSGPACPTERLPMDAYVVVKHSAYGAPTAGTSYIAPVQDGTTAPPPGYDCCTTAAFENTFELPHNAAAARISLSAHADNQAAVAINGVEFGRHPDGDNSANHGGPPLAWTMSFPPDPSGTNRLTVTLTNLGGAIALQYHAVVTYEITDDDDRDGTPNTEDAFPSSDMGPTIVIDGCDTGVLNQTFADSPGSTFADLIGQARATAADSAAFLDAVSSITRAWFDAGLVNQAEMDRIGSCAAGASEAR